MRFFEWILGRKKQEPTADELNAIFAPLRDRVADFKDETGISWTIILPAIQSIALKIILDAQGTEAARKLFSKPQLTQYVSQKIPLSAIVDLKIPDAPPEHINEVNGLIWRIATEMTSKGHSAEHISQAFSAFSLMIGAKVVDQIYASALLKSTYRELNRAANASSSPGEGRAALSPPNTQEIRTSGWQVQNGDLVQQYGFFGGANHGMWWQLRCTVDQDGFVFIHVIASVQLVKGEIWLVGSIRDEAALMDSPFSSVQATDMQGGGTLMSFTERAAI